MKPKGFFAVYSITMQYSPRLKKAAQEIKEILDKHDIAGVVVLHTPGNSEYLVKLDPTYSCVKTENGGYRIKSNLQEDHKGDKQEQIKVQKETANMLNLLSTTVANIALPIMEMSETMDKVTNAHHTPGAHTSHTEQNN